MASQIVIFLETASLFLVLVTVMVILWVNPEQSHSKRMLSWFLLSLAVSITISISFHFNVYTIFPWFFKVLLPVSLLIYPLSYLYVRAVVRSELKFRRWDWLLFIPAFLYTVSLLPFYFMPIAEKEELLLAYSLNPALRSRFDEGILPAYFFPIFRVAWSAVFSVLNTKLIHRAKETLSLSALQVNKDLVDWLRKLNLFLWVLLILAIYSVIANFFYRSNLNLIEIFLSSSTMLICFQLFFTPKILYGFSNATTLPVHLTPGTLPESHLHNAEFPQVITSSISEEYPEPDLSQVTESVILNASERQRYKHRIEVLFNDKQPYLQPDYNLSQMVKDTGMPRYLVSAIINQEFGQGFREFLNRYRVDYFMSNINSSEWQNITLEAIANQCGFVSRSTFITNFRQITGQTPSEYVKSLQG